MELCLDFLLLMNLINFLLSTQFIDELRSVGVWVQVLRRIRLSRFCECMLDFHVDPGSRSPYLKKQMKPLTFWQKKEMTEAEIKLHEDHAHMLL